MALVTCPDCGKKVSSQAPSCPSCGALMGSARPLGGADRGTTTRPDFWHDRNVGCVAGGIVLVIILFFATRGCR